MKRLILMSTALLVMIFAGCKKEDSILTPKMQATIGGESWQSNIQTATLYSDKIIIVGTSLSGTVMTVTVFASEVGTYELSVAKCAGTYSKSVGQENFVATQGSVTISKLDKTTKKISGTFAFNMIRSATETLEVKLGTFSDITFTEISQ